MELDNLYLYFVGEFDTLRNLTPVIELCMNPGSPNLCILLIYLVPDSNHFSGMYISKINILFFALKKEPGVKDIF